MEDRQIQELIINIMPSWHCYLLKPFKQLLHDGISPDMYYTIKALCSRGELLTMSELAQLLHIPKQQSTRLVNRLIECSFVERVPDSSDRRLVRLRPTAAAREYLELFMDQAGDYYCRLLEQLPSTEQKRLSDALQDVYEVLTLLHAQDSGERCSVDHCCGTETDPAQ